MKITPSSQRTSLRFLAPRRPALDLSQPIRALPAATGSWADRWLESGKIGSYALASLPSRSSQESLRVIVSPLRFEAWANSFLAANGSKRMTLELLFRFLAELEAGLKGLKSRSCPAVGTILLEDLVLAESPDARIGRCLLGQALLEAHSRLEARVVMLEPISGSPALWRLLVKRGGEEFLLVDLEARTVEVAAPEQAAFWRAVAVRSPEGQRAKEKAYSLFNADGEEITFQVSGRTPTERRFAREEGQLAAAAADEPVPFEILFHPFWRRYGHTTLRIGESLYEFSSDGWRAHNTGLDSARAFLFNNPFFKGRLAVFSATGMPPVSYGVTRYAPKASVLALRTEIERRCALKGREREKFNLFLKNCNQTLRALLRGLDIPGFEEKGYPDFSSVLTFHGLLQAKVRQEFWLYPLPGVETDEASFRRWVPRVLYLGNNTQMEMKRAAKSVLLDIGLGFAMVGNRIAGLFGRKLWHGAENRQHLNELWPELPLWQNRVSLEEKVSAFVARYPANAALVEGVAFKKKESSSKNSSLRPVLVISGHGLTRRERKALLGDYRAMITGAQLSFSIWEKSTHLFLQNDGRFFDFGFWVIPLGSWRDIRTKLYRFRERAIRFPNSRRLEPVVSLGGGEKERLGTYLSLLAHRGYKAILGRYYDPGCQFTNARLDDNRAVLGHNCTSWVTTAPIGDEDKCLLEILGAERAHEIGTNPGWWIHWLLYAVAPERVPLVLYWSPDPLAKVLGEQVVSGQSIRWDFNKK